MKLWILYGGIIYTWKLRPSSAIHRTRASSLWGPSSVILIHEWRSGLWCVSHWARLQVLLCSPILMRCLLCVSASPTDVYSETAESDNLVTLKILAYTWVKASRYWILVIGLRDTDNYILLEQKNGDTDIMGVTGGAARSHSFALSLYLNTLDGATQTSLPSPVLQLWFQLRGPFGKLSPRSNRTPIQ